MSDDPGGETNICLAIIIFLYVLSAIFASSTAYLHSVNEKKLRREADMGNLNAKKLVRLIARQGETTTQFGMIFLAIAAISSTAIFFLPMLKTSLNIGGQWGEIFSAFILIMAASLFLFIFIDFIPKKIIAHKAPNFTFKAAPFLCFINALFFPFQFTMHFISNSILRLFGFDPATITETVTEEELMMLVDESEERGVIEETEKDMIENILEFNDTTVSEIMTHRTDISAAEDTMSIARALSIAVEKGRSRIPVFHEDIDSIVGILYVKDLLPYIGKEIPQNITLQNIARPAYFIPESKKCSQLFNELTDRKTHIAIIVDEYGGTSGLVTIEDLIESIVGNIQDEYDNEKEEIFKVNEHEFTVDGSTSIDEVSDLVGFELPEGDYDTIAGFVTERLGRILKENERPVLVTEGLEITVGAVVDQRILHMTIKKIIAGDKQ